jgi:hypothetical protein
MNALPFLVAAAVPALTASLDTTATAVGARLRMHLTVDAPEGFVVEPPAPPAELGPFRVRSVQPGPAEGTRRSFDVWLVPLQAGRVEVPPVTVRARRGNDPPVELASPPLAVAVSSNLEGASGAADSAAAGSAEPARLKPALDAPRDWRPVWIAAGAALAAFALAAALIRRLRRRERIPQAAPGAPRTPARPAWEIALEELDRIAAERWVERGELRRQYEAVTEALRRYLENRWGIPALESTTDELRGLLRRSLVPAHVAGRVLSLLGEADLVKFAKARPDPDAARAGESRVREVVLETIPRAEPKEAA